MRFPSAHNKIKPSRTTYAAVVSTSRKESFLLNGFGRERNLFFSHVALSIQSYAPKLSILLRLPVPIPFAVSPKAENV